MPFSSLTPVSLSSTPVRLDNDYEHGIFRKHLPFLTFPYDQGLCSLQVPSLFAVSSLEPYFDDGVRLAQSPGPTCCRCLFFLNLVKVTRRKALYRKVRW